VTANQLLDTMQNTPHGYTALKWSNQSIAPLKPAEMWGGQHSIHHENRASWSSLAIVIILLCNCIDKHVFTHYSGISTPASAILHPSTLRSTAR